MSDEMRAHLELQTEENISRGMAPEEARYAALRAFGGVEQIKERAREQRFGHGFEQLGQDLRYAARLLRKSRAFTLVAIATLAIGIGANTAIFSALDAVMLRPLPYPEPERLTKIFETTDSGSLNASSGGAFLDWREHQTTFDSVAIANEVRYNLRSGERPERLNGMEVSHEFLRVFGLRVVHGRGFQPEEDRPGGNDRVVLLTEELWRSHFGADPAVVGEDIVLDDVPRTVIGVLAHGAGDFSDGAWIERDAQFLVPLVLQPEVGRGQRTPHWANVFGRLKPGVSATQAQADLKAIKQRLDSRYPGWKKRWSVAVRPLHEMLSADRRTLLLVLLGAVGLVLLIGCANVANLLLARACQRQQEIALRAALGATSGRIVRQMLTESVLLAAVGGGVGVALAYGGVALMQRLTEGIFPGAMVPQLDGRVLAFSAAATALTGGLFGVLPAWRSRRPEVNEALKSGGKNTTAGRQRVQSTLVVAEVTLTVVLLAGAGLLLRSLAKTASTDPGFEPERALAFELSLPRATYAGSKERLEFSRELLRRIRTLPGVEAAGAGTAIPFRGGSEGEFLKEAGKDDSHFRLGRVGFVSEGFVEALGARAIVGRTFSASENRLDGPRVAVIDRTAADTFFSGRDPIGRSIFTGGNAWEVVGVVGDIVERRLDLTHRPFVYFPQAFSPYRLAVVVRSATDPAGLVPAIRAEIRRLNPGLPMANVQTLDGAMRDSMSQRKMVLQLVGAFALTALTLACVGLYGVLAYSVATRRRELSIRLALGASRGAILAMVLRQGLRLVAIGLTIGLVAGVALTRTIESQLYGVTANDPVAFAGVAGLLAVVAAVACWLPARLAARSDPMVALRAE